MALPDYPTSPFYLFLNAIIPVIFLGSLMVYAYVRGFYSEKIRSFIDILLLFVIGMIMTMIFRFYADASMTEVTGSDFYEWIQSLTLLVSAFFFVIAGNKLKNLFGGEE